MYVTVQQECIGTCYPEDSDSRGKGCSMNTVKIAFRNNFRNRRRSAMTMLALGVGAVSMLLFGGYIFAVIYGVETNVVQAMGHLHVYRKGFFQYGSGNPGAYSFGGYEDLEEWIREDPHLKDLVEVVTPALSVKGIAGNFPADASKVFIGTGVIPSDRQKMRQWNDYGLNYGLGAARDRSYGFTDEEVESGVIGVGMARMLQLCGPLHIAECSGTKPGKTSDGVRTDGDMASSPPPSEDFSYLIESNDPGSQPGGDDRRPKLDLLAATAAGAPNVVTMVVNKGERIPDKALDDRLIRMHLSLAQRLLFARGEKKVNEIVIQLKHTKDMSIAKVRLQELLKSRGLDMEVKDLREVYPAYGRILSFLISIFTFIAVNMGVIVLFTVANTMSMSVMERVNEIGAVRALGVRRSGVLRQFLLEGCILGILGATMGVAAAMLLAWSVNTCGLSYVPPGASDVVPLTVQLFRSPLLLPATWLGLVLLAGVSSLLPARRAGRMVIVDALRHV
jgi:putative ABC transport system permease protein